MKNLIRARSRNYKRGNFTAKYLGAFCRTFFKKKREKKAMNRKIKLLKKIQQRHKFLMCKTATPVLYLLYYIFLNTCFPPNFSLTYRSWRYKRLTTSRFHRNLLGQQPNHISFYRQHFPFSSFFISYNLLYLCPSIARREKNFPASDFRNRRNYRV